MSCGKSSINNLNKEGSKKLTTTVGKVVEGEGKEHRNCLVTIYHTYDKYSMLDNQRKILNILEYIKKTKQECFSREHSTVIYPIPT